MQQRPLPSQKAAVRHDLNILTSQGGCGGQSSVAGMKTLPCVRELQTSYKSSSTRQFLIHPSYYPSVSLTSPSYSNPPAWKQLISSTLSTDERINFVISIFSDCDEIEIFEYLSENDTQAFVDVLDEASIYIPSPPKDEPAESH